MKNYKFYYFKCSHCKPTSIDIFISSKRVKCKKCHICGEKIELYQVEKFTKKGKKVIQKIK